MVKQWIQRALEPKIRDAIKKRNGVLLLGPRQTGKTSLLERFEFDLEIQLLRPRVRLSYEKDPEALIDEVEAYSKKSHKVPLVLIDEIQKVPGLLDPIQFLTDKKKATFFLTGSSARKLKFHAQEINFLPGRVLLYRLDPLSFTEYNDAKIEDLLTYGSLPAVLLAEQNLDREELLRTYVETYLEEEVRKEALVRKIDIFARFLELAAIDSGRISSFSQISQQLGVAHTTIASHYQILEDCLIAEKIEAFSQSTSRKKLMKSPKYLFFDLGVRRIAAGEGIQPTPERYGEWFEQWVGLELLRMARHSPDCKVMYWRDPDGPEVDWLFKKGSKWIPIEVKWTDHPIPSHAKHLETFIEEYPRLAKEGIVVCRVPKRRKLSENVIAVPWNEFLQTIGDSD